MSLSRRSLLATPLLTACKPGRGVESPESWPEVRVARYRLRVPPGLLTETVTQFQVGSMLGFESSNIELVDQRWGHFLHGVKGVQPPPEAMDPEDPEYYISRTLYLRHEMEVEGFSVVALHARSVGSDSCSFAFRRDEPAGSLCGSEYYDYYDLERALEEFRGVLAAIRPHPSSHARNPWSTCLFEFELPPDLGQFTNMQLSDGRTRVLEVDHALTRGREALDMGGAARAYYTMLEARYSGFGKHINAMRTMTSRRVMGMTSTEFVWTLDAGDGGLLNFVWVHRGTAFDVTRPYLLIHYSGDLAHASARELRREWNTILRSIALVPQAQLEFTYEPG